MKIKPLSNRIVIKYETAPATQSLIVIPDSVKTDATRGEVVAAGPGKIVKGKLEKMNVKVGDVVLFPRGSGAQVEVDKQKYIVMFETDILGIAS